MREVGIEGDIVRNAMQFIVLVRDCFGYQVQIFLVLLHTVMLASTFNMHIDIHEYDKFNTCSFHLLTYE